MIKSKKLLFRCVLCAVLVFVLCVTVCLIAAGSPAVAHAEELPQEETEIVQEVPEGDNVPEGEPTFFGRIWEWAQANVAEILTVVGDIVLVGFLIAQKVKQKKKLAAIGADVLTVKDGVTNTEASQRNVVSVTNELIEGYNRFEKALNNFDATEQERYKTIIAAFAQTKAILEIMTTVYANSKNIPQGVKDLVNLKYADVLKLVGDEDKLKEIVEPAETEPYAYVEPKLDVAADPVVRYMDRSQLSKNIEQVRKRMTEAAKRLDFIEAAQLRDELIKLEDLLKSKNE